MSIEELGCCGAYCKTCKVIAAKVCKGCKADYNEGGRDLKKAKCKIKVCCMTKGMKSCADCADYDECSVIQEFHHHSGYKYGKYKQAIAYIKEHGYNDFFESADSWSNAYGKYQPHS